MAALSVLASLSGSLCAPARSPSEQISRLSWAVVPHGCSEAPNTRSASDYRQTVCIKTIRIDFDRNTGRYRLRQDMPVLLL